MNFAAADTFKSSISLYEFWRIFFWGQQFQLQFWDFSPTLKFETSKIYFEKNFFNEIFLLQKKFFFQKNSPKIFFQKN